jgi:hypothetical protein
LRRSDLSREQKELTVFFDGDKMKSFTGDFEQTPVEKETKPKEAT